MKHSYGPGLAVSEEYQRYIISKYGNASKLPEKCQQSHWLYCSSIKNFKNLTREIGKTKTK